MKMQGNRMLRNGGHLVMLKSPLFQRVQKRHLFRGRSNDRGTFGRACTGVIVIQADGNTMRIPDASCLPEPRELTFSILGTEHEPRPNFATGAARRQLFAEAPILLRWLERTGRHPPAQPRIKTCVALRVPLGSRDSRRFAPGPFG